MPSRRLRRLGTRSFRLRHREFLAEGPQAVREAVRCPDAVLHVYVTEHAKQRYRDDLPADIACTVVDDEMISRIAATVTPQGIVAHCRFLDRPVEDVLKRRPRLAAICADVRDPGNAGTLVRCADAAGAEAVLFSGHSVDPYNPKAVRASTGSLFHLDLAVDDELARMIDTARAQGLRVIAADGVADSDVFTAARDGVLREPTAWLFGNEAWGLPDEIRGLADEVLSVPIYGRAESLNLATAAAVCLYTSAQAQRAGS